MPNASAERRRRAAWWRHSGISPPTRRIVSMRRNGPPIFSRRTAGESLVEGGSAVDDRGDSGSAEALGDVRGLGRPEVRNWVLRRHSLYSASGSESHTMPLPVPITPVPPRSVTVRIDTLKHIRSCGDAYPIAPQ